MSESSELTAHSLTPGVPAPSYITEDLICVGQKVLNEIIAIQAHYSTPLPMPSVQYIPSSPTPLVYEVNAPPLHIQTNQPAKGGPYPPLLPGLAETIIRMGGDKEFRATARAIAYGLVATICRHTTLAEQQLIAA